ncbi:Peptidase S58 DmpA/arginine biosynthesis protein ArgJ [Penicillium sp. IBT 35674x]|nr:Peptidase S58 DmpA/arginine biosynthesis protein ArgJ [Penicillium sp. IBT 35674x]
MAQSTKRGHSPEEEKQRKRQMLLDNRINFEGPINPTKWPQCHSSMFSAIRKIEDIRYNNYVEQFQSIHPHSLQMTRTIAKADYLLSAAKQCPAEETNEDTWREKTESRLLITFSNAMECQKCKLLQWPFESRVEEQETQQNLAFCSCTENILHDDRQPFAEKRGAAFTGRSVPGIWYRRPDRVIGFRKSPALEVALKSHPNQNSSPGKDAKNILFPFLVLEAKAENNSCFSSVESQTALPIKTLVDVQKSLRETGRETSDTALVWFFGIRW